MRRGIRQNEVPDWISGGCRHKLSPVHNQSALELEVTNWRPDILLQDFLIKCRIHGSINYDITGHTPSKKLNFCRLSPQNICPKVLGIIKIFLPNVRWDFVFFLVSSGFCLGTLPWMPFVPSLFLLVESWTLTLTEASEACSALDVVLGYFMTSWRSRRCVLEVI